MSAREQVGPFTDAGHRRRVHVVPRVAQDPGDPSVAPAAVRTTVHQDEGRQRLLPLVFSLSSPFSGLGLRDR